MAQNLQKNEDRIVAEMGEFGVLPPFDLLRAASPARTKLDTLPGPSLNGPSVKDRLREQARLAKVVLEHKRRLAALRANHVGLDLRPFDPTNPTLGHEDIVLFDGMTSWEWVKSTWDRVTAEIALILNAWPALYAADVQGALGIYADQKYDATDPLKGGEEVSAGQNAIKTTFTNTLRNVAAVRDKLSAQSADPLDFTPVHRALWGKQVAAPSGEAWSRAVILPILNDEREVSDDVANAGRFAIEAALFVAMTAGVIGTMGGAAIAIGVAGASALKAQDKVDKLAAARGTAIGGDSELVTKEAVSAAAAEAEQAKLELAITTVTSVLSVGVEAAASRINPDQMRSASAVDGAGEAGTARTRLRGRQVAGEVGLPGAPNANDNPAFFNKLSKMTATSRKQALDELLREAERAGIAIHTDADAQAYLDFAARAQGIAKEDMHACTLGGDIFVRAEHAGNVRVLREELLHTFQQAAGYSTGDLVRAEIEARWMIVKFRHTWSISNDEVREMLKEIRQMKRTGKY